MKNRTELTQDNEPVDKVRKNKDRHKWMNENEVNEETSWSINE